MNPRFVQGFIDESARIKAARQAAGPAFVPPPPAGRPAYAPGSVTRLASNGPAPSPVSTAPARPPVQPRPEVNTGAPDYSGASQWAMRGQIGSDRPLNGVNSGPLLPPANVPPYVRPIQPMDTGMLAQPGEDSFQATQNTRAAVTQHDNTRRGLAAAPHMSRVAEIQAEITALREEQDALIASGADDAEAFQRAQQIDLQTSALAAELDKEVRAYQDELGIPSAGGMALLGGLLSVVSAPGEWGASQVGDLGFWYAQNRDNPGAVAALIGAFANSPIGAALSQDDVGLSDYIRFIDENASQVEDVRRRGYTAANGTHYTGGEALFQMYLDSNGGLVDDIITQAIVDPTTYVSPLGAAGRRLIGPSGMRFLPEGAAGRRTTVGALGNDIPAGVSDEFAITPQTPATVMREGWVDRGRTVLGNTIAAPQIVLDEAADRGLAAIGRGARALVPDSWLETPLASQVAGIVQQIDAALRTENVGRRQLREGETSARRGVGADQREFADASVPYDASPQPEVVPPPVIPVTPIPPYQAVPVGDVDPLRPIPGRAGIDASQWVGGRPPMAAPPLDPALPPGRPRPDDPYGDLGPVDEPDLEPTPTYTVYARPEDVPVEVVSPSRTLVDPDGGEEIEIRRGGRKKDGTYNYRVFIDGEMVEGPTTRAAAEQYARGYVIQNQPPTGQIDPVDPTAPRDLAVTPDEDVIEVAELEDGTWGAFLPDDEIPLVTAASEADVRAAVADIDADDLPPTSAPAVQRGVEQAYDGEFITAPTTLPNGNRAIYIGRSTDDMPVRIVERVRGGERFFDVEMAYPNYHRGWEWKVTSRPFLRGLVGGDPEDMIGAARSLFPDVDRLRAQAREGREAFTPAYDPPAVRAIDDLDREQRLWDELHDEGSPVADMDVVAREARPTGQTTLPTDPQTQWRQFGVGRPKMVDSVLDNADDYAARGLAPQVDAWLRWREDFVGDLNASRGTPSANTPSLQSVTDRAEEEIAFARIVGEAPPAQTVSYESIPADEVARLKVSASVAEQAERAMFDPDDLVASKARRWFRKQGKKKIAASVDPEYGQEVTTFFEAADYLKWLRQRRDEAVSGGGERIELLGSGFGSAAFDLPSFLELNRIARGMAGNISTGRRLKRARVQAARQAAAARRRSPLPPGTARRPILSDAEERLLNTRIADLGKVGRADTVKDGVVTPRARDAGDTATVRSVYDPAREKALARGLSEEDAHREGMKAVTSRIEADFGLADQKPGNRLLRGIDTYTNYVTMMARYGTPIASARSIQTDMVGDFVQTFLREGPVTAADMVVKSSGYVRRGFRWADTRAGEIAQSWGLDVKSLSPREGIVRSEAVGGGPKSPVRRVFAPKFGKVDLDTPANPGTWIAKPAEVGRKLNEQMEMGRRTALKLSMVDTTLTREKRRFAAKAAQHRRLLRGGDAVTDDDLAATVADLGSRFSPEDVRLAMERLAVAKGARKDAAARFGERVGRDWANIRNGAVEDAAKRVNRALFSYEFTKADEVLRRFVPFHYWSSRAIPFYVETAIRNPAFALAYYRLAEGLSERAEAEGWPASLRFMVQIWSGPMGYLFFADPIANMGLLGVTEMLFPNEFDDGQTSSLGRWLQTASGRGGVGLTPIITSLMGYAGLMGEDQFVLDFTGTRPVRSLVGAVMQAAAGSGFVGDPALLDRPVDDLFMAGRAYASRWASKWIPGAREIPATDPQAYPKQQIRNGMIDLRMQERGYTSTAQLTEEDWEVINTQFEEADGPLYEEAVSNYSWANLTREGGMRVLSGPVSVRQEGQFARQVQDRRENPMGDAAPGQEPTQAQAYEATANLNGRYGRTGGGISLPEYDPYADYHLTPGEIQFMELWYQETGERYEEGDLEAFRERTEFSETMAETTPEAAPYVAGEIGYYDLGPEAAAPLLAQYYNIMFANPDTGLVVISGREWGPKRLAALTQDERATLADAWLQERDTDGSARRTLDMREAWKDAHPEYARYKAWDKEVGNAWEGNLAGYRAEVSRGNPNAARYFENQSRLAREEVGPNASPQEYQAELDRRTTNLGAYLAIHGIKKELDDPNPASTGDASRVPGPYDPRPAGFGVDEESGAGGTGGGAAGPDAGGTGGSSSRSREEWATETIAASEAGIAQANALLTQQMGYPVDVTLLPPPIQESAMAMLPPGLIPDDAWLYFDYKAWQSHQQLMGGPTDLLSYLAATANDRDWKARRTTSSAGGATLVGGTPAETYYGPPAGQAPATETRSIPGGSYAAYLAGA